ncbi:MAG: S8 family peptidase [Saprospiraceae bacterium]|nr:S8 family peptidase [Saprospiraceae bacterium]
MIPPFSIKKTASLLCCFVALTVTAQSWQSKITPSVFADLQHRSTTEIIVVLQEQGNLSVINPNATKEEKGQKTVTILRGVAERSQTDIRQFLTSKRVVFHPFWLVNALHLHADYDLLRTLAERQDVAEIMNNPTSKLSVLPENNAQNLPETVLKTWGVQRIGADSVWLLGYRGQGAVVGGADTGYDWTHPALQKKYRGFNAATNATDHNYNWFDAIEADTITVKNPCGAKAQAPCDDNRHGTHTMGTMIGGFQIVGTDSTAIGVAPDARWIGARNMDRGDGTLTRYIACFEWFTAPTNLTGQLPNPRLAPHVINNSWYCSTGEGCNSSNFSLMERALNATRSAGIVVVVSAGNAGPSCSSFAGPAGFFDKAFSIGATQPNDTIAGFSSRGPVTNDGSNRRKPNVSAPGVGIVSAIPNDGFASLSGTSMAGPHVAGAVALMISANPLLAGQVDTIEKMLEITALPLQTTQDCGTISGMSVPNHTYGWGRIDVFAAVKKALLYRRVSIKTTEQPQSFIKVFPNPFSDKMTFYTEGVVGENSVIISNINGQTVFEKKINFANSTNFSVELTNMPSGIYFYKISNPTSVYTGKIIKN